jgi:hypothetical protein
MTEKNIKERIRNLFEEKEINPSDLLRSDSAFFEAIYYCSECDEITIGTISQGDIPICNCGKEEIIVYKFPNNIPEIDTHEKEQENVFFWNYGVLSIYQNIMNA